MIEMAIAIESPDQPEIAELLAASDAYMAALYPAESNHLLDIASLRRPEVIFIVARAGGRQPEALALYRSAGFAEIGAFGRYLPDPLSIFMEKPLGAATR